MADDGDQEMAGEVLKIPMNDCRDGRDCRFAVLPKVMLE
jgi:hypothetical protein